MGSEWLNHSPTILFRMEKKMKITKLITIDSSTNKSGIGYYENGNFINYELLDFSYDKVLLSRYKKMTLGIWELLEKIEFLEGYFYHLLYIMMKMIMEIMIILKVREVLLEVLLKKI